MKSIYKITIIGILFFFGFNIRIFAQNTNMRPVYSMQKDVPVAYIKSDSIPKIVNRDNEIPVSMNKNAPVQNNKKCDSNNVPIIITNQKEVLPTNLKKEKK
ncbi:MAG: hypothetical protein V2A54_13715 [Bacteroidota bacterium]